MTPPIPLGILATRRQVGDFLPTEVPGLFSWHDAADLSTITVTGGQYVTEWRDKSGNDRHLEQLSYAPTYSPYSGLRSRNGLNTISTDNVSAQVRYLGGTAAWDAPHGTTTWFVVHDRDAVDADMMVLSTSQTGRFKGAGAPGSGLAHSSNWPGGIYVNGAVIPDARSAVHSHMIGRATVARWTATPLGPTLAKIRTSYPASPWQNASGLCEIIAYEGALPPAEITKIENYLMSKWGI